MVKRYFTYPNSHDSQRNKANNFYTENSIQKRIQLSSMAGFSPSRACQGLHVHCVVFRNTNMTVLFETEQNDGLPNHSRKDAAWVPGTAQEQAEASSDGGWSGKGTFYIGPIVFPNKSQRSKTMDVGTCRFKCFISNANRACSFRTSSSEYLYNSKSRKGLVCR